MIKRRRKAAIPVTPGMKALASIVVNRRGEKGMTQAQLASEAGVSHRAVQYLEAGRCLPIAKNLAGIARALDLDAAELRRIGTSEPAKAAS